MLLAGIGAVWVGKEVLFVEAYCPRLQDSLLYGLAVLFTLIALLWALRTRHDSVVAVLGSIFGLAGGILIVASVAGSILSSLPGIQAVHCPPRVCAQVEFIHSLRQEGKWAAAEEAARDCLAVEPSSPKEEECQVRCAKELALALYETSDPMDLPAVGEPSRRSCCEDAAERLKEAYSLAQRYGHEDLALTVMERQRRLDEACNLTPPPTPTPHIEIEVLRARREESEVVIDVRVFREGRFIEGLQKKDLTLLIDGATPSFEFEARYADDPICLIAVVDNSGSIEPGLNQIHEALQALNEARKPEDEMGLVVFGTHEQISRVQPPAPAALSAEAVGRIDATGEKTALWDGILEGLDMAQSCSARLRYLLVMTDGIDNDSRRLGGDSMARAREIARIARDRGVSICTVGVKSEGAVEEDALRRAAYGCQYSSADNFDELATLFIRLFGYVRDFYRLKVDAAEVPYGAHVAVRVLNAAEVRVEFTGE